MIDNIKLKEPRGGEHCNQHAGSRSWGVFYCKRATIPSRCPDVLTVRMNLVKDHKGSRVEDKCWKYFNRARDVSIVFSHPTFLCGKNNPGTETSSYLHFFLNCNVRVNHQGILLKYRFLFSWSALQSVLLHVWQATG